MKRNTWGALSLVILTSANACTKAEPALEGHYVLRGSTADTVPFVAEREPICVHTVLSGTADFKADGTYTSTFEMRHDCTTLKEPAFDQLGVKAGTYRMVGDTTMLYNDVKQLTGHGYMKGEDTLLVRGSRHTLIYVRP